MIDVSFYQGQIDWRKVRAAGVEIAAIKATEGTTYVDRALTRNVRGARAAGVRVFLYHYAHPSNSPLAEARHFLATTSRGLLQPGDLPPALDLEVAEGHSWQYLNDWKAQWLHLVDDAIGIRHGTTFYSYYYFWKRMSLFADRPLWLACFGDRLPAGVRPNIWQYRSNGRCPGIDGPVDFDRLLELPRTLPPLHAPA